MRTRSCVVVTVLMFALAACLASLRSAASERAAPKADITIDNFTFTPPSLMVKVGTRITWTNRDDIPHSVMSDSAEFHSKALDTDDSFSFTPTKPGTYSYFCSLHPKMTAKVVVE